MRLLFASIHGYLDLTSGAALCTRELLDLMTARGMDCRVLTIGVLDAERDRSLDEVLANLELPASARPCRSCLGPNRMRISHG